MRINITKIYKYILKACKKQKAKKLLYLISFFESILFPFPTDPFLIPYIIADKRFVKLTIYVTLFSVLGGLVGYFIGYFFWENFSALFKEEFPKSSTLINNFEEDYNEFGILLILVGGFSPFPYKITSLASGIFGINVFMFIFLSILSRGCRFFLVAFLIYRYGEASINVIKKNILILTLALIYFFIIFYFLT